MSILDIYLNPIDASSASFVGHAAADVFPHDIYSYLIETVRTADRDYQDLFLLRFLEAMQSEFEDTYDRINALLDVFDVERCPAEALQYLKWIVGWTSRLDFVTGGLSEVELRTLIAISPRMWSCKGTDRAISYALSAFSGYHIRVLPWFFFRTLIDEVEVGRAELDVDPWLIDIPGMSPSTYPDAVVDFTGLGLGVFLNLTTLLGATEAVPHTIRCKYVPTNTTRVVASRWDAGTGANYAVIPDAFGQGSPASVVASDYRVGVDPDEYVTDLRIVDDGSLNRDLVENLIRVLRPSSERYFIHYLDFQDTFGDELYWNVVAGTAVQDRDDRVLVLEDAVVETDFVGDAAWTEYTAMLQFKLRDLDANKWFDLRFYNDSVSNHYAVRVNPTTRVVSLERVVAGVRVVLDSVALPAFHADQYYTVRAVTHDTGAGHQIKYYLSGNHLGTVVDGNHTIGRIAVATAAGQFATVTFAEVFQHPLDSTRVGPE